MALSSKPYIGSRDFFPDDMDFRNWMFGVQRNVCERYGYREYASPILEPVGLYQAKTSDEIVNEQLYRFTDRGDRELAIRPEMTPTLARLVASRLKEEPHPIRWYSIANFMRYERPGRGRLREFYQLNADLLGPATPAADAEILFVATDILRSYGAREEDYDLRYSDRRLFNGFFSELPGDRLKALARIMDKREKLSDEDFRKLLADESLEDQRDSLERFLSLKVGDLPALAAEGRLPADATEHLVALDRLLNETGYAKTSRFDPGIVRGFDYYTAFIFEIFDNHPENRRSIFGGGRYDRLLGLFGKESLPAVGFGMGDVTLENFIRVHDLVPGDLRARSGVFLTLFSPDLLAENTLLARELREAGISVETALSPTKKFGRQLELADKKNKRTALVLGADELAKGVVRVKDLASGEQWDVPRDALAGELSGAGS